MPYMSDRAKGMSGNRHISKTAQLNKRSIERYLISCEKAGKTLESASAKQDIHQHTDYIVDGETVDLKALKESARDGLVLLEFKNVNGKSGWCNPEGTPTWIAFDFGGFFLHAKNIDLYNLAQEKCDFDTSVSRFNQCLYKAYTRRNRKDLMSMVKLQDVLNNCEHWFLPYPVIID